MTTLPRSFLARIARYPAPVRAALSRPLDPAGIAEHLRVLHGASRIDEDTVAALLRKPMLVDGFLGRQLNSGRFIAWLGALLDRIDAAAQAGPAAAGPVAAEALGLFGPLGDPMAPYLHKLREIAARPGPAEGGLAPERAQLVLDFAATARATTGAAGAGARPSAGQALARALIGAARGDGGAAWTALAAELLDPAPALVLPDGAAARAVPEARALARVLATGLGLAPPDAADRAALAALPARLELREPVPLRLAADADPAWRAAADGLLDMPGEGGEDHAVLHPAAAAVPSPVTLALLRAGPEAASGPLEILDGDDRLLARIEGAGGDAPRQVRAVARAAVARDAAVPAAEALAIVLRLDDEDGGVPRWDGFERCHLVEGHGPEAVARFLAALTGRGTDMAALADRPVVLAGRGGSDHPEHLTGAVARHWAHGGRYPVSQLSLLPSADRERARAGRLDLARRDTPHLTRLLPASWSSVPLEQLARIDLAEAARTGVIALTEGVAVCDPGPAPTPAARAALERALAPERLGPAMRARIHRAGRVGRAMARELDAARHWPLEELAARIEAHHRALEDRIADFARHPDPAAAAEITAGIDAEETDPRGLAGSLATFLQTLAQHGDVLAATGEATARRVLEMARDEAGIDAIAADLALWAPEIGGARDALIRPLFEVLATGLPPEAVREAWAALAEAMMAGLADGTRDGAARMRAMRHLAAAGRRHGGPAAMARLLMRIGRDAPDLLGDARLMHQFRDLAEGPRAAGLAVAIGRDPVPAILAARDPRDAFLAALAVGDTAALADHLDAIGRGDEATVLAWLDGLRGATAELRRLGLESGRALPPGSGLHLRKLAAAVLGDGAALCALEEAGLLADASESSALARAALGRPGAVADRLEQAARASSTAPPRLSGDSAAAVFRAAAASVPAVPPARAAGIAPRVSVAVSAHDPDPELLSLSLASIRAQTCGPVEILLIDDASGARGRAAIDAACTADPALRLIRLERNVGPYMGRNRALEQASGAMLAIQDADDWSHPDRFRLQLEAFDAEPELQLVTTPHIRIDADGRVQPEAGFAVMGDGPMSSMFRCAALRELGGFARVRSRGDVEMRERIAGYFGPQALKELAGPPMLCFAAPNTLSRRVHAERREALQLFRGHLERRMPLADLHRDEKAFDPAGIVVPWLLRPESPPLPAPDPGTTEEGRQ